MLPRLEYKGYTYEPDLDIEPGENSKIFHHVFLMKDGVRTNVGWMPMSPYCHPRKEVFHMWIDCGMPSREDMKLRGNARNEDIENHYNKWIDDRIDQAILGDGGCMW